MAFHKEEIIRFRHCDPAGIVFYPRYLEILNDMVEDWFKVMGYPFEEMGNRLGAGVPTINLNITFMHPCRQGETLSLTLRCLKVGDSSFEINISGEQLGQPILDAQIVLCFTTIGRQVNKLSIPDGIRKKMQEYLTDPTAATI
ncbi:acyl-CoA thioesterase [Zobellella maritima]|uniref:acyl-CoA thioesterase n=1 Tax=Zobellella maritima TaxID=2059725 RepID=UPI000E3043E2|nr:acyl-CoA thioesterase [Zobellella maritima]